MQAVRDIESPNVSAAVVVRKYSDIDRATLMRWIRQFGNSNPSGSTVRREKPPRNRLVQLRSELRLTKQALVDAHMELALEKAYLAEACDQLDQTVTEFKKKPAGWRRTRRSKRSHS
jgi:transposase-like protein